MPECKFIWNSLPQQILEQLGEEVIWNNLPNRLNEILSEQMILKPTCYESIYPDGHNFLWFDLTTQLEDLCLLIDCTEVEEEGE